MNKVKLQLKRFFDIFFSLIGLIVLSPIILLSWFISSIELRENGFFYQERIGKNGKPFFLFKIKTMRKIYGHSSTVTTSNDSRISFTGKFFRKTKIDELPQLVNVLIGDMSFVGPRPDVKGFADMLDEDDKLILNIRPGITGPASLAFRNEEEILSLQKNPERYNREVIYPEKVKINLEYIKNWTLLGDLSYILKTIFKI
mgnify:CR=1 FL=1